MLSTEAEAGSEVCLHLGCDMEGWGACGRKGAQARSLRPPHVIARDTSHDLVSTVRSLPTTERKLVRLTSHNCRCWTCLSNPSWNAAAAALLLSLFDEPALERKVVRKGRAIHGTNQEIVSEK